MAKDETKYQTPQAINPFAAAMMAAGDSISGIYGQRGNTYATYVDAQMKRQAIEQEAQRYAESQALELFKQQQGTYEKQQDSMAKYAEMGMRPIDPARAMSPGGNMPSKAMTGAYGQTYVPSPALAEAEMRKFQAKSDIILGRQLQRQQEDREYKASEESGMSADAGGRYEFANEALRNIPKLRSLMFPDGKPESFRRDIATKMMTPWKYPNDAEVQDAKRWILSVATGRGLIQSGTVIKDNEWSRLMDQVGINVLSAPTSVFGSLGEQEEFMHGFKRNLKPGSNKKGSDKPTKDSLGLF